MRKERPSDLNSKIAEMQNRIKVGEEILLFNQRVQQQSISPRESLQLIAKDGRSWVEKITRINTNHKGEPFLDQIHDYYLAIVIGPNTTICRIKDNPGWIHNAQGHRVRANPNRIQFETQGFVKRRSSYEFGQVLIKSEEPLKTPTTAQLIAVGRSEIDNWMVGSAYNQEIYRQLSEIMPRGAY